jgi:hypothetical protein
LILCGFCNHLTVNDINSHKLLEILREVVSQTTCHVAQTVETGLASDFDFEFDRLYFELLPGHSGVPCDW